MSIELENINDSSSNGSKGSSGASLFDIKTMANAIAEKGWAFTCKSTRQDLAKASVPTVYNDILEKYNNVEESLSASSTKIMSHSQNAVSFALAKDNNYIYVCQHNSPSLQRTLITDIANPNWETIPVSVRGDTYLPRIIEVGDNLLVCKTSSSTVKVYKKSDWSEYKSISISDYANIFLLEIDGKKVFYISYILSGTYHLDKIEDSDSADVVEVNGNIGGYIGLPVYDNGTFYFWLSEQNKIYKTNDFITLTELKSGVYGDSYHHYNARAMYKIGNTMLMSCSTRGAECFYTTDNGATWISLKKQDNSNLSVGGGIVENGVLYCQIWDGFNSTETRLYKSTDLVNYTIVSETQGIGTGITKIIVTTNAIFYMTVQDNSPYYFGIEKVVYTDTINGTEINYYKNGDYKICVADNTNDTALATVYSYMGYYNYYRLDTTNETVSLPRNSNLYSMMYVGDNYQDTLDGITGNVTRLLPQAEVISDSSATVSLDVKGNKDYQLINSALTSLTITTCEDSQLGTTIQFNSGATATTITDSASIEWVDGSAPTPSADKTCLIFIWNNKGFYKEW